MKQQIKDKIEQGFKCIKMKIGAIDFKTEMNFKINQKRIFIKGYRTYVWMQMVPFQPQNALEKLKDLSELDLHSIEQPIKQGQFEDMAKLCEETPLPIALDEELIGVFSVTEKEKLLQIINPQYIILKPSLVGGFKGSEEWINTSKKAKYWLVDY